MSQFLRYLGDPDIHDGRIVTVKYAGTEVRVVVDADPTMGGRRFTIVFHHVDEIQARRPEGMVLYALSEWTDSPPRRRFVFSN